MEDASGFVSVVGQRIGEQIDEEYKSALQLSKLSREQVAEVLVDLKRRIEGDFYIIEQNDEKIVLGNRACPFGDKVVDRPALCMMTSNVFGVIASENLGYAKWADLLPDALILVSGTGTVVAANRAALKKQLVTPDAVGNSLCEALDDSADDFDKYLRMCRRSRKPVTGVLRFTTTGTRYRSEGASLNPPGRNNASPILLRIPLADTAREKFILLNEKLGQLSAQIERRKRAESNLRRQLDMAAFGRDIGLILAQSDQLQQMLQRCAESLVQHLDAAFARIWILDTENSILELQASAGIYTHLDGEHSRIRVGQYKIGMIAAEQKPHLTNSVIGDPRVHDQQWAAESQMVAFAGYPLIVDQRTVGVMALFARHELQPHVLDALSSVATSVALGIERKQVESSLKQQAIALEEADRRKDEFLAMLAHELRNPLAPIRSGLELLIIERGEDCETLRLMNESVEHLVRLVDDLLDVSRIMRDRIDIQKEPVELGRLIRRAIRTIEAPLQSRGHTLVTEDCEQPLWIEGDAVRISQVLLNVLGNAVKYTPEGGRIELLWAKERDSAIVRVVDNGVGIDRKFLPQVFELFAQADRTLDRSAGGLGIGLTLSNRLVSMHGGDIRVMSEGLGKGTTFEIRIPLVEPPAESSVDDNGRDDALSNPLRILVVDDSVGAAKILRRLLESVGQRDIDMAHDGPAALEMANETPRDLIFLDIGLPGLDGYCVAESLRSDPKHASTHIVALTGYGDKEFIVPALVLGAGLGAFFWLKSRNRPPERVSRSPSPTLVATIGFEPEETGFEIRVAGNVVPRREVTISAQVSGAIVEKAREIQAGRWFRKNVPLVRIDPARYELAVKQLASETKQIAAELQQLDIEETNNRKLVTIAESELELAKKELKRVMAARARNAIAESEIDKARQSELKARNVLRGLNNFHDLVPVRRKRLQAQLKSTRLRRKQAQLDLDRTRIVAPFDGTITHDAIELGSFVQAGDVLLKFEETDTVEIECSLRPDDLYWLWNGRTTSPPAAKTSGGTLFEVPNADVTVTYRVGGRAFRWEGKLSRFEGGGVDRKTRMIPCRVIVPKPRRLDAADGPPSLMRGMHVSVSLKATPRDRLWKIPIRAVQPDFQVWTIEAGRLKIHTVEPVRVLEDGVLIRADETTLKPGTRLVTSQLANAFDGMPVRDATAGERSP
eukprot:g10264.t1